MNRHVAVWNATEFYRNRRGVSWIGYRGGRRTPGGGRLRGWLCDRIGPPSIRSPNASWKRGRDDVTAPWVLRESQCGCRASSRPAAIRMVRVEASGRWSTNGTIWRTVAASASPAACETNTRRRWYPLKSEATTSLTAEDSKQSSSANFNVFCCCCCCFYIANSFWLVVVLLSNSDHSIGLRTFSALSATTNCSSYTKKAAGRKKRERQWRGGKEREREKSTETETERQRQREKERQRERARICKQYSDLGVESKIGWNSMGLAGFIAAGAARYARLPALSATPLCWWDHTAAGTAPSEAVDTAEWFNS